jgi:Tfp pilus assembly protein PilX
MLKQVFEDQEGIVLILVLIILVAAIITGVTIMRTSALEARIAGNERVYTNNFNNLESAVTLALTMNTLALASVATTTGKTYEYPEDSVESFLPVHSFDIDLRLTLSAVKKPPKGSGSDPNMKARYYTIQATHAGGSQSLTVGAYKIFPQAQSTD